MRLLVGTKRGLFVLQRDAAPDAARDVAHDAAIRGWRISEPRLAGREVYHAIEDARTGTLWAATNHVVWGAHVHRSTDGGATWETLEAAPHHADERGLSAIWHLAAGPPDDAATLYAGVEPAGLFVTRDEGASWQPVTALNDHESRTAWQPAGGGLALGSIQLDPRDPQRIWCALSAGGVYRSDDGGASWRTCNRGVRADFLPDRYPRAGQCVHRLLLCPTLPDRLYQQNHCGVYRSDDRGDSWTEITGNLPSEYGYALAVDPADAGVAYVIPEASSHMRTTPAGRLRVYRTRDGGGSWEGLTHGLPQAHAYVSVLRDGMCRYGDAGVAFGTTTGHLFASDDAGGSWALIAGYLPRILSVTAGRA